MIKRFLLLLCLCPAFATADTLPYDYRATYSDEDGAMVIETPGMTARWMVGDWAGLSFRDDNAQTQTPVQMEENGPPPDLFIGFDPVVRICDRDLAVATFAYAPSFLREQAAYTYLRVLFSPDQPDRSWQIWDEAASELAYAYQEQDLTLYYEFSCSASGEITYQRMAR